MYRKILMLVGCAYCCACAEKPSKIVGEKTPTYTPDSTPSTQPALVGADRDAHNCIGSAGYTWSELLKECIRVFEKGIQLDAKAAHLNKTVAAFVVFKSATEQEQVELFLPDAKSPIFLPKAKEGWANKDYTLSQVQGKYSLTDAKKQVLYEQAK